MFLTRKRKLQLRLYRNIIALTVVSLLGGFALNSALSTADEQKTLEAKENSGQNPDSATAKQTPKKQNPYYNNWANKLPNSEQLPSIPSRLPAPDEDGFTYLTTKDGQRRRLTLDGSLQTTISKYIEQKGNHIAAVVVVDVKTGKILAMAQGQDSTQWNQSGHSALYTGFPAASVFKNITTAAAIDVLDFDENKQIGLQGGCANVHTRGVWMKDVRPSRHYRMSLKLAYGRSCNGFYAQMAVKEVGLGAIKSYAQKFGWGQQIPADFQLTPSPIMSPNPADSSIHTVGRFAAGFGLVGMSAVHAAWFYVALANDGNAKPITLFEDTPAATGRTAERLVTADTASRMRSIMRKTTHGGTASSIFRKRRYRRIRKDVGGKTGTLNGKTPRGLTNWFVGMMPLDNPEIVVASVSVTGNLWIVKAPHIAAESFLTWKKIQKKRIKLSQSLKAAESKNSH